MNKKELLKYSLSGVISIGLLCIIALPNYIAFPGNNDFQPVATITIGQNEGDSLANRMFTPGDLNGDGFDDIIFNSYYDGLRDEGSFRAVSGRDNTTLYEVRGQNSSANLGRWVVEPGDLDGDSVPDFFVSVDASGSSSVTLAISGADGSEIYQVAFSPRAIFSIGDVNNDGKADFVASDSSNRGPQNLTDVGAVKVFSGLTGEILYEFFGAVKYSELHVGAVLDDVNNDGVKEFITIGRYHLDGASSTIPSASVLQVLSGIDGESLYEQDLDFIGAYSTNIFLPGDLNGDNVSDFLVINSNAQNEGGDVGAGRVEALSGSDFSQIFLKYGDRAYDKLTWVANRLDQDLNEDGINDLTFFSSNDNGTTGFSDGGDDVRSIWVVSGATGETFYKLLHTNSTTLSRVEDLDEDGLDDYVFAPTKAALSAGDEDIDLFFIAAKDGTLLKKEARDTNRRDLEDDYNSDGIPDYYTVTRRPDDANIYRKSGRVTIYSGADDSVIHQYGDENDSSYFGMNFFPLPDVDADNVPDFAIADPGFLTGFPNIRFQLLIHFYSGKSGEKLSTYYGLDGGSTYSLGLWNTTITAVGDLDKNGYGDFVLVANDADLNNLEANGYYAILNVYEDECPKVPAYDAGICGCGIEAVDSDNDGTPDCKDECSKDPNKIKGGTCGCGFSDTLDTDGDKIIDCLDLCPEDPNKHDDSGAYGCGVPESSPTPENTDGGGVDEPSEENPASSPTPTNTPVISDEQLADATQALKDLGKKPEDGSITPDILSSIISQLADIKNNQNYSRKERKLLSKLSKSLDKVLKAAEKLERANRPGQKSRAARKLKRTKKKALKAIKRVNTGITS